MAVMTSNLYRTLVRVGASEDDAAKTAEEVVNYDNRITKVEGRLDLLVWMVGFNLILTVGIAFMLWH